MTDPAGATAESEELLIAADTSGYELILGTPFLNHHDPDLRCGKGKWYVQPPEQRRKIISLVDGQAFRQLVRAEGAEVYAL